MRGGVDLGGTFFVPDVLELLMLGRISDTGMGPYPSRMALAARHPTRSAMSEWGWKVSTPCGTVSTEGIADFVPGVLELHMYGSNYDQGMGPYPPRVELVPRTPASQQSVGDGVGASTP